MVGYSWVKTWDRQGFRITCKGREKIFKRILSILEQVKVLQIIYLSDFIIF